jgi:hypothetical protein
VTQPTRRFGMQLAAALTPADPNLAGLFDPARGNYPTMANQSLNAAAGPSGIDLMLTDVVSFDVRLLLFGGSQFVDLFDPTVTAFSMGNPAFQNLNGPHVFDTWSGLQDNAYDYSGWAARNTPSSIPLYTIKDNPVPIANMTGAGVSPIVINSPNHGLATGHLVAVSGVLGNFAANGTWSVTVQDANNFALNGSTGNGAWNGGGTWMPQPIRVLAVQVTIRIWDSRTEQTRQVTIIQDL